MAGIVEIHVPLVPTEDLAPGAYPFPRIDQIEELLVQLEEEGAPAAGPGVGLR